jgi:hypothetical protein
MTMLFGIVSLTDEINYGENKINDSSCEKSSVKQCQGLRSTGTQKGVRNFFFSLNQKICTVETTGGCCWPVIFIWVI